MNTQTTLNVTGMSCGSCVRHIGAALQPLGVADLHVDLRGGTVTVRHDDRAAPVPTLIAAIQRAGFGAAVSPAAAAER